MVILFLLYPVLLPANPCLRKTSSKDARVLILPLDAGKDASLPSKVLPVLLQEYLSHVDGIDPLLAQDPATSDIKQVLKKGRDLGAGYVVAGSLTRKGSSIDLKATLLKTADTSGESITMAGNFLFPNSINDLLIVMTERIAAGIGKNFKEKKLLPYLMRSSSAETFSWYAEGVKHLATAPDRAVASFRKALEKDYNFVPAYTGLAEALARAGARGPAQVELAKARILNPVLTEPREACIESLIKAGDKK